MSDKGLGDLPRVLDGDDWRMTKTVSEEMLKKLMNESTTDVAKHMDAISMRWQNTHGISKGHANFILTHAIVVVAGSAARAAYHSASEESRFDAMKGLIMRFAASAGVECGDIEEKKEENFETVGTA
jgi:hypothetical protein